MGKIIQVNKNSKIIFLPDGRRLSFFESGDLKGKPIFFFHGLGSSRLGIPPNSSLAKKYNLRIISVDRPGVGMSDPKKKRSLLDWTEDVNYLADQVEINKFSILGWSAGGAFALACAHQMPDRIESVSLLSSVIPVSDKNSTKLLNKNLFRLLKIIQWMPWIVNFLVFYEAYSLKQNFKHYFEKTIAEMSPSDRLIAARPVIKNRGIKSVFEAYAQNGQGIAEEYQILTKNWGFDVSNIKTQVNLNYGTDDQLCPPSFGKYLKEKLPFSKLTIFKNEAHLLFIKHWEKILKQVT